MGTTPPHRRTQQVRRKTISNSLAMCRAGTKFKRFTKLSFLEKRTPLMVEAYEHREVPKRRARWPLSLVCETHREVRQGNNPHLVYRSHGSESKDKSLTQLAALSKRLTPPWSKAAFLFADRDVQYVLMASPMRRGTRTRTSDACSCEAILTDGHRDWTSEQGRQNHYS